MIAPEGVDVPAGLGSPVAGLNTNISPIDFAPKHQPMRPPTA
jgi:hypothetical protein